MRPWGRITESGYRERSLLAHRLLADVPLHDVWRVFLPDSTRRPFSMAEVRQVALSLARDRLTGPAVSGLFGIRRWLGALGPGNPRTNERFPPKSIVHDVPQEILSASLVRPGSRDGPFRVVYVLREEALGEVRNKILEAYLVGFLRPVSGGNELLLAVHVLPSTWWTRPYLALISPFRRFLVYPHILRKVHEEWQS